MKWIEALTKHNTMTRRGIAIRSKLFPVLHLLQVIGSGCKLQYYCRVASPSAPCIYVANHSNCHDLPVMARIINRPFFVLASDEPRAEFAGLGLWLSGVIWSNREDKRQRSYAKELCVDCVRKGCDLLVFPEGTWNISQARPMLPLSWGVIDIAWSTGVPIIPVALEYDKRQVVANMGKPYYVSSNDSADKKEQCDRLRDTMATLRWECWESKGVFHHDNVTQKDYQQYSLERIREYGLLTEKQISSWVLRQEPTEEQVFACLKNVAISKGNAFLIRENAEFFD